MLPSIQSIPVYGFLFHPTKITSWGKNVQEYGVKTIKSVENKYLWSTFLVEVLVCLDEADRQNKAAGDVGCPSINSSGLYFGNSPVSVSYRLVSNKGSTLLSQIQMFSLYLCIYKTFTNFAPMQYGDSTLAP